MAKPHESIIDCIECDNFKLQYRVEGTGIPAIVIGSAIYYPRTFSQNLRNHLRLIFMDHRGFTPPQAPLDTSAFELDVILNDIDCLRKKLGLEHIVIIGHSGHGFMALEYAKKYSEHVSHVVLIGMGPDNSDKSQAAADQYFQDSVCSKRKAVLEENLRLLTQEIQAAPESRFITFCLRLGARSWYDYQFDASFLWENVKVNMQIIDYLWGNVFRDIDITKGLESFNKPVFLGLGQFDFLVAPFFSWNSIRPKFKNLTMRVFEKSSHTPQYEEPQAFDQELLKWLPLNNQTDSKT